MRRRSQADDEQAGVGVAEARNGPRPVVIGAVGAALLAADGRTVVAETRTALAGDDRVPHRVERALAGKARRPEQRGELVGQRRRQRCLQGARVLRSGAGGLGQQMDSSMKMFAGGEVMTMLLVFIALVALVVYGEYVRLVARVARDPARMTAAVISGAADLTGRRIGWLGDLNGHLAVEPGILDACEAGLRRLESLGCSVEPVSLPMEPGAT